MDLGAGGLSTLTVILASPSELSEIWRRLGQRTGAPERLVSKSSKGGFRWIWHSGGPCLIDDKFPRLA